jgi:hypothetical protein
MDGQVGLFLTLLFRVCADVSGVHLPTAPACLPALLVAIWCRLAVD